MMRKHSLLLIYASIFSLTSYCSLICISYALFITKKIS